MRCPICNADTDAPDDCGDCQSVIYDTVQSYGDTEVDDDDDQAILLPDAEGDALLVRENYYGDEDDVA